MNSIKSLILLFCFSCSALMALTVSEIADVTPKVDEAPVPIQAPPPKYPEALRKDGITGVVIVTMVIDEHGSVIASEIKKTSNEAFNAPALEAIARFTAGAPDGGTKSFLGPHPVNLRWRR
jgi:protein TonB